MNEIKILRQNIDQIDSQLLTLIYKRVVLVGRVKEVKDRLGLPTKDSSRERKIMTRLVRKGSKLGISQGLIQKFWKELFRTAY